MRENKDSFVDALRANFAQVRGYFPEFSVCCPFCDDQRWRFCINVVKELAYCFNCEQRCSSAKLKELLGLKEVFEKTDIDVLEQELETLSRGEFIKGFLDRPGESACSLQGLLFSDIDSKTASHYRILKRQSIEHLEARGFDAEKVAASYRFLIPAPRVFKGPRLGLPIYEDDQLVFYQARSLDGAQPKYLNPKKNEFSGKSDFVFNLDRIDPAKEVLVCEGIFSAIAAGAQAVAVLGKTVSMTQYFKILSRGVESVTVLFDPGAEKQAIQSANLLRGGLEVKVAFLEDGDPNEVDSECLRAVIKSARNIEDFDIS